MEETFTQFPKYLGKKSKLFLGRRKTKTLLKKPFITSNDIEKLSHAKRRTKFLNRNNGDPVLPVVR